MLHFNENFGSDRSSEAGKSINSVTIGKIVNAWGIKGEVKVYPLTDIPGRFHRLKRVLVKSTDSGKSYQVEVTEARYHKGYVILKMRDVSSREDAEALKDAVLEVAPEDIETLPEGQYYHFEICGLRVYELSGEYLGEIREVLKPGGNDVYVVIKEDGRELLLPAIKDVIRNIDLKNRIAEVKLPEGLG